MNPAGAKPSYDAVVVGAGPNGLAAGIVLARAGRSVLLLEAAPTVGGGARTAELTLAGFRHDVCSAIHPLACASPFFRSLNLDRFGLQWIHPPMALAHPLDDGSAATLENCREIAALLPAQGTKARELLIDLLARPQWPKHPLSMMRFAMLALQSAWSVAHRRLHSAAARGLWAGLAGHSMLPLERAMTSGFALMLALGARVAGWPIAKGGSQAIADALAACFVESGGQIVTGIRVENLAQLPVAKAVLLDVTPRQFLAMAGDRLPLHARKPWERFRYGPGVFKMDWALAAPVPWRSPLCRQTATLHLGGSLEEIAAAERAPWQGRAADHPLVLVAQPSLFDPTRAPPGKHTLWAYCHVPHGSTLDMTARIEAQIERFAPGFAKLILQRHTKTAAAMQEYNANYIGGDINGGVQDLAQHLARPVSLRRPYATPLNGVYLCSSSTPPGGGVHGMCG